MKKVISRLSLVLLVYLLIYPVLVYGQGVDNREAWALWNSGYESYLAAKTARARGDFKGAEQALSKARECYLKLKELRPDWKQEVIDARLELLNTELAAINGSASEPEEKADVAVVSGGRNEDRRRLSFSEQQLLQKEVEEYRKLVIQLTQELETMRLNAQKDNANSEELANLLKENRQLAADYAQLERQYNTLESRINMPDAEKDDLRTRLVEERIKSENLNQRIAQLEKENVNIRQDSAGAYRERNELRLKEQDLNTRIRALERELEELRNRAFYDDKDRADAVAKLAARDKEIGEKARQLEELTGEMTRLKELYNNLLNDPSIAGSDGAAALQENIRLYDEVHQLKEENRNLVAEVSGLNEQRRGATLEMTQLKDSLRMLQEQGKALEAELEFCRNHMKADGEDLEKFRAENNTLKERVGSLENDLVELTTTVEQQRKRLESGSNNVQNLIDLNTQNRELAGQLAAAESELKLLRSHVEEYEKQLTSQNELAKKSHDKALADLAAAQAKIQSMSVELASAEELKKRLETVDAESRIAQEKLAELPKVQQELAAVQKKNQELTTTLEQLRGEHSGSAAQLADLGAENSALKEKEKNLTAEIARLEEEVKTLTGELTESGELLEKFSGKSSREEQQALRKELDDLAAERQARQARLAELRREAEEQLAREAALTAAQGQEEGKIVPLSLTEQIKSHLSGGEDAVKRGAVEVALFHYRKILELEPDNRTAVRELGLLEAGRGNRGAARELLARSYGWDGLDLAVVKAYAGLLLAEHQPGNALSVLAGAVEKNPEDYDLLYMKASALGETGEVDASQKLFNQLLLLKPDRPEAYEGLAVLLAENFADRLEEAAQYYNKSRENGGGLNRYLESALADYLAKDDETVEFLYSAAAEAEKSGDWESAMWFYVQLTELEPTRDLAKLNLAWTLLEQEDYAEAAARASEVDTPTGKAIEALSLVLSDSGNIEAALKLSPGGKDLENVDKFWNRIGILMNEIKDRNAAGKLTELFASWQ